ncbi:hypothetical protein QA943_00530 [Streptomyces sp. B21-097]
MIANADHVIGMGPGSGTAGGTVVATGTPDDITAHQGSVTGSYLHERLHAEQRAKPSESATQLRCPHR